LFLFSATKLKKFMEIYIELLNLTCFIYS